MPPDIEIYDKIFYSNSASNPNRKVRALSIISVLVDVEALVVAIGFVVAVIIQSNKSLTSYFVLPVALLGVHVYGNTVQELELGPEWIRNHLHNTGVAGLSMIVALIYALVEKQWRYGHLPQAARRIKLARSAMNQVLWYWLISAGSGISLEIVTATIWDEGAKAAGYSGKLDWFDLSAYLVGALIVTLNHLWFKRRIIAKMQRRYGVLA